MSTAEIKNEALEVLRNSTLEEGVFRFPTDTEVDTAVFSVIKDEIIAAGGKYQKKTGVFKFKDDFISIQDLIDAIEGSMKEEPKNSQKEKRTLRYDFTASEIHDLSLQLAGEAKKLQSLEEEKSSVVAQYGAKIKESKATLNKLSNLVADGWEFKETEVEIFYHQPENGKKTIVRQDTQKSHVERMEPWEYNLFNQPKEEEEFAEIDR